MERLTKRNQQGEVYIPKCFSRCDGMGCREECNYCDVQDTLTENLAAYEDTNLNPERITEVDKAFYEKCQEVNRLNAELAKAEPYVRLAEKMNLCDLVAENQRLTNELIFRNAELLECKEALKRLESVIMQNDLISRMER